MNDSKNIINDTLVKLFNQILFSEEKHLQTLVGKELSIKEIHVLECVGKHQNINKNSALTIATALNITAGTLTTAINKLEKKGFVNKIKDMNDKRGVKIFLTDKGKNINNIHKRYHEQMTKTIINGLTTQEVKDLERMIDKVQDFFNIKEKNND